MKIIFKDLKKGTVKIRVTSLDDLWVIYLILKKGDVVRAETIRKIKLGNDEGRQKSQNILKKTIHLTLEVEKVTFHKYTNDLRISGKILEAPEDIKLGSFHTFSIEPDSTLEIRKDWLKFELEKIEEASKEKKSKILICVLDREDACFAFLKDYGYDYLSEMEGDVEKKDSPGKSIAKSSFYVEIRKKIEEYFKRQEIEHLIIASPAFFKDLLLKELPKDIQKVSILATCNSFGRNAIEEVIKRAEVQTALQQERMAKEAKLIEELFRQIAKEKLAVYGDKDIQTAINLNAAKEIFLSTAYMHKLKEKEEKYIALLNILKQAEKQNTIIHMISSENEAGKRLDGLGGIASILRFEIE